jgi:hypothetical protein
MKSLLLPFSILCALLSMVQASAYFETPGDQRASRPVTVLSGQAVVPPASTPGDVWAQKGPLYATPSPYPDVARASNARNCRQWSPRPEDNTCHASDARQASGVRR